MHSDLMLGTIIIEPLLTVRQLTVGRRPQIDDRLYLLVIPARKDTRAHRLVCMSSATKAAIASLW